MILSFILFDNEINISQIIYSMAYDVFIDIRYYKYISYDYT